MSWIIEKCLALIVICWCNVDLECGEGVICLRRETNKHYMLSNTISIINIFLVEKQKEKVGSMTENGHGSYRETILIVVFFSDQAKLDGSFRIYDFFFLLLPFCFSAWFFCFWGRVRNGIFRNTQHFFSLVFQVYQLLRLVFQIVNKWVGEYLPYALSGKFD